LAWQFARKTLNSSEYTTTSDTQQHKIDVQLDKMLEDLVSRFEDRCLTTERATVKELTDSE